MSKSDLKEKKEDEDAKMKEIKEYLTCSVLKKNYIDDSTILLGYPIVETKSGYNQNKIELYPIPEMLTYEGFLSEINNQQQKLDLYFETNFRTSRNQFYNCWMPIYLNKEHYEKNKTHVLNSFSIIKFGSEGKKEYDFKPEQIFEILPIILNKMIIGMFNGKSEISSAFIRSYFQYVLLYKKLCEEFEDENMAFINKKLSLIYDNNYVIDKKIIPDIGNFLMTLFFCNIDTHEEKMQKMWEQLFEEFLTRQMFWIFHNNENRQKMKRLVLKTKNNEKCLTRYENEPRFKMNDLKKFNEDLTKLNLFEQIVDIISKDEKYIESIILGKDKIKEQVQTNMVKDFKKLFSECNNEGKKQISDIISNNLDFSDYFDLFDDEIYDNFKLSEILKDENIKNKEEILKYAFDSQIGNKLLIITFFAQKKVEEKGFLENLEKNYGIYLDVDIFIKEMQTKLEEIKTFKDLYEYVGSDLAKDKTDMELLIEYYDKAKDKGYLNSFDNSRNYIHRNFRGGRGRDRGRDRDRDRERGGSFRGRGFRGNNRGGFRFGTSNRGRYERSRNRARSRSRSRDRNRYNNRGYSRGHRRY